MPTVPRRGTGYVQTAPHRQLNPAGAFNTPEPVDISPIAKAVEQHIEKVDQLAVLEADNQLSALTTNLETQTLSKRGKDALDAGQSVQDDYTKGTSDIEASLSNDRQKQNFRLRADHRWQQLNSTVQKHGAVELQKYDAEQSDIALKSRSDAAVSNYADPKLLGQQVAETKDIVALYGKRNGWSPEKIANEQLTRTTNLHTSVIARMVADGNDIMAEEYFKKVGAEIDADSRTTLEVKLETASSEAQGQRGATEIWTRLGPKGLNDPVVLSQMENDAREKYGDRPKVLKNVIQELRSRKEAHNSEQTEVNAANQATVLGAFSKGASVSSLTRSTPYLSLSGTDQERLKHYMLASQRADANREPDKKNWAAFWGYSQPAKLAAMSENQILSLVPEVGQSLVNQLMTQKRSLGKSEDTVRTASIDADQFGTIAEAAGLKPYEKDTDKATLGKLRSTVETEIDRAQQAKGKLLTRDEKQEVMQRVIDQKVMLDFNDFFSGPDKEQTAAIVSKDDRDRAYVPIERVSRNFVRKSIAWMRENGNALPSENETQVQTKFQKRLERAYGRRIMGGTDEEIFEILAGR